MSGSRGAVSRVSGPVVEVEGLVGIAVHELVEVGPLALPGEVSALKNGAATVQVYDHPGGLRPGAEVVSLGRPLSAGLGPGLLGGVFDGVLRPLTGGPAWLQPGLRQMADRRAWNFTPVATPKAHVPAGALLGTVPEGSIQHRILVPPDISGTIDSLAGAGALKADDVVAVIDGHAIRLVNQWPVRRPRPVRRRLETLVPLLTGQRAIDILYPISRGGTAAVPGGFGTGKTVLLQQIAKWCDADVIVYVGCGERGNEMADVLEELPRLEDPRTGRSLSERTVIIANTSNMPVMAREASIHSGITVAEYFRDMGLDSVVIADSTSRWAEAMREFASRTGQLPAEEGYPAGLASAMAAFYERAGRVDTLAGTESSVSVIASVSPPGGDMTEPVTSHTTRFIRCLWSLDRDLADARHYPAISWRDSFSRDAGGLSVWHATQGDPAWAARRERAMELLAEADRLESVAQLVGVAALPSHERVVLMAAKLVREAVLQQSALSANDGMCGLAKQAALLDMVLTIYDRCVDFVARGATADRLEAVDLSAVVRAREEFGPNDGEGPSAVLRQALQSLEEAVG